MVKPNTSGDPFVLSFAAPDAASGALNVRSICKEARAQYRRAQSVRPVDVPCLDELRAIQRELAPLVRLDVPDLYAAQTACALHNRFTGEDRDLFVVQSSPLFAYFALVSLAIVELENALPAPISPDAK